MCRVAGRTIGVVLALLAVRTANGQRVEPVEAVRSLPAGRAPRGAAAQPARLLASDFRQGAKAVRLAPLNVAEVVREDAAAAGEPVPMRIGINRKLPEPLTSSAAEDWHVLPDGTRVWSATIEAPEAEGIRVHFATANLPDGSTLVIAGNDGVLETLPRPSRNRTAFWAPAAAGDRVVVEYQEPPGAGGGVRIVIDEISHIYRGTREQAAGGPQGGVASVAGLLTCHEDVNCHDVDIASRDAVGRMVFTVAGQGSFLCTGALLNDADPNTYAGYFLTANHCISTQAEADGLSVYWFYQTNSCNGSVPSVLTRPKSVGAVLLNTSDRNMGGNDSTLLRLDNDPSDGQGFAAWTTGSPALGSTVRGIHHPGGSYKRFSEGFVTQTQPICGGLPLARYVYNDWTEGITEGGSSGSPLFNENWQVVGQLFGACYFNGTFPGCDNPNEYNNVYGRFSFTYPQISSYLNGVIPDDAYEDNDDLANAAVLPPGTHNLRLVDFSDYFVLTLLAPAEITAAASFDSAGLNLNLQLLGSMGETIDSSTATSASTEVVSAKVTEGTYYVLATRVGGWGGDYTLDLSAIGEACPAPAPVTAELGGSPRTRYVSVVPGNPGQSIALRVRLDDLENPMPPNNPGFEPYDFGALEGTTMWVGAPFQFAYKQAPPVQGWAAQLQCEPYYQDWSALGVVHIFAPEVMPSSTYSVTAIAQGCDIQNEASYSAPLIAMTARWGDVVPPYQDLFATSPTQPNVLDIAAVADAVKQVPGEPPKTWSQLRPSLVDPRVAINALDIAASADGVKGRRYPYHDAVGCP